jgi:hypothetical protein
MNSTLLLSRTPKTELTIVSASDFTHERSLRNLLQSLVNFEKESKLIVYDLGMNSDYLDKLKLSYPDIDFRDFQFGKYPDFFNIRVEAGSYAWKSAILEGLILEGETKILWMDAGNLITGKLKVLREAIKRYGFFSPYSVGNVSDWTHPLTLERLKAPESILNKRNLGANVIAFDSCNERVVSFIQDWTRTCSKKELIAPAFSNRNNHRQDQSLLTVLAYVAKIVTYGSLGDFPRRAFKILVHQDAD